MERGGGGGVGGRERKRCEGRGAEEETDAAGAEYGCERVYAGESVAQMMKVVAREKSGAVSVT